MFRKLRADEIDVRIQSISYNDPQTKKQPKGASLLLYKDARADMNILDETVGELNWKREHSRNNANCTVSLYNKDIKEWVSKEDTGTQSNAEAEKGLASDSFKRACFNWGIGRELYTAGFIWVNIKPKENLKYTKFTVSHIAYKGQEIDELTIIDGDGTVRFNRKNISNAPIVKEVDNKVKKEIKTVTKANNYEIKKVRELYKPEEIQSMLTRLKLKEITDLSKDQAKQMIAARPNEVINIENI